MVFSSVVICWVAPETAFAGSFVFGSSLCAKALCILSTRMNESLSYIICNKRIKVLNAYLKVSVNCGVMSQGLSL